MDRNYYDIRGCHETMRIITDEIHGIGDKDIHNLELILYSIKPHSYFFRRGCIKTLRKAIELMKEEKNK